MHAMCFLMSKQVPQLLNKLRFDYMFAMQSC